MRTRRDFLAGTAAAALIAGPANAALFGPRRAALGARSRDAAQTKAFLARVATTDANQIANYRDLINGLVADGVLGDLDILLVPGADGSDTLKNLVQNRFNGTLNGSVSAIDMGGYRVIQGVGPQDFWNNNAPNSLSFGFNPSSSTNIKFSPSNGTVGVWSNFTWNEPGWTPDLACDVPRVNGAMPNGGATIIGRGGEGNIYAMASVDSTSTLDSGFQPSSHTIVNADQSYLIAATQIGTTATRYINGALVDSGTVAVYSAPNGEIKAALTFHPCYAVVIGKGLSAQKHLALTRRLYAYFVAIGLPLPVDPELLLPLLQRSATADALPIIGANTHQWNSINGIADSANVACLQTVGAKIARVDMTNWDRADSGGTGVYDWSGSDSLIAALRAAGMKINLILTYNNPHYGAAQWSSGIQSQANLDAFVNFCKAVAGRYYGSDIIYEIWNEPNLAQFWTDVASAPGGFDINADSSFYNFSFSNGCKTAETLFGNNIVRTTNVADGKIGFKITVNAKADGDGDIVGFIADGVLDYASWSNTGGAYNVNGSAGTAPTWGAGDVLTVLIDAPNKKWWTRTNSGNWNNNPSADPVAGTGSFALPNVKTAWRAFVLTAGGHGGKYTIDTGASLPSGFSPLHTGSEDVSFSAPADAYAKTMTQAAAGVVSVQPGAKVITAGISTYNDFLEYGQYIRNIRAAGTFDHIRGLAIHPYQGGDGESKPPERAIYDIAQAVNYYGPHAPLPLHVNESGFPYSRSSSNLNRQAVLNARALLMAILVGAETYVHYDLIDDGTDTGVDEFTYGLFDNGLVIKPSGTAFAAITAAFSGCTSYSIQYDRSQHLIWITINKASGKVVIMWTFDKVPSSVTLATAVGAYGTSSLKDVLGNSKTFTYSGGSFSASFAESDGPLILSLS